jgi:hypothetical protein
MVDINIEEINDTVVAEATSREKFDVISFFSGAALPTEKVVIYRDIEAAYELNKIYEAEEAASKSKKKNKQIDDLSIADADNANEAKIAEYRERLNNSAVTFHLRGLAPAAQTAIEKSLRAKFDYKQGADNDEYNAEYFGQLIGRTIQYVTNAEGARDDSTWDRARVDELAANLPAADFGKLSEGVLKVTYAGNAIDAAVNADFS